MNALRMFMRKSFFSIAIASLAVTAADWHADAGEGSDVRHCERQGISVTGADDLEYEAACSGAKTAISFLKSCNIDFEGPLDIRFEADMRDECGADTYAMFTVADKSIRVNSYKTCHLLFDQSKLAGRIPFDLFFKSVVAHETTHAAVDRIGSESAKRRIAHEYAASVVQYSMYDPAVVRKLAGDLIDTPHVALSDFSDIVYGLSAEKFAVMAYTHFTGPDGGCKTLRDLVTGERQMREPVHPE